jgi:hypothetical protein
MKLVCLIVLLLSFELFSASGFTYFWTPAAKDTVTATRLKANYDTTRLWANRTADTINTCARNSKFADHNLTSFKWMHIDTIDSATYTKGVKAPVFTGAFNGTTCQASGNFTCGNIAGVTASSGYIYGGYMGLTGFTFSAYGQQRIMPLAGFAPTAFTIDSSYTPPTSATATGNIGSICWDSLYIYVKVRTGVWKRSALTIW